MTCFPYERLTRAHTRTEGNRETRHVMSCVMLGFNRTPRKPRIDMVRKRSNPRLSKLSEKLFWLPGRSPAPFAYALNDWNKALPDSHLYSFPSSTSHSASSHWPNRSWSEK